MKRNKQLLAGEGRFFIAPDSAFDRRTIAYHEAGHAVMSANFEIPFDYETIATEVDNDTDMLLGGHVMYTEGEGLSDRLECLNLNDEQDYALAQRIIGHDAIVGMAARAAVETAGISAPAIHYKSDEKKLCRLFDHFHIKNSYTFKVFRQISLENARQIVSHPVIARAVRRVAIELEAKERLTSEEVQAILEEEHAEEQAA